MDSLHEDVFASYDHDFEPEPEPLEEDIDSSCTPGKRKWEETEEPAKSALELAVASQAAQRNDESEDTIPEPIPKPVKAKNETMPPQKVAQMEELRSPFHGLVQNINYEIAHRLPPRIEPRAFILLPTRHTFTMV
ncbi:hypothetical protein H9Q73_013208 [Fusarium xylarioides]|nr:hypothetical protein H9Q73_013208 [Fusarium xylarioides]